MAYRQMANFYDQLMDDAPYDKWLELTIDVFQQSGKTIRYVADLGCGTGRITTGLAKLGYNMTGVDSSEEMLSYAQQHAISEGTEILWIHQDLRELEGINGMDAVISYCDVINYITTEKELRTVFRHTAKVLQAGGLFLFDVHSLYHVQNDLANMTFSEVDEDVSYIWFCTPGEVEGEMHHDLTFFVADANDKYIRFDEYHHQRTFPIDVYKKLLHEAGFEIRNIYGDFSVKQDSIEENTERIFFIAEKRAGK
ncbi:methyltransferase [Lentibacillus populi]|uniref:Methyltransferase n=1 Tax=Lentibacillus populi TaxID=1827502 RepID=A0A9W5TTW7_9BACI|nr:class I SAM-dependent methyltransferase [Lentibacillus populi]GGB28880.1 methyltransferase [Lentibacillus populi]